MSISGVFDVIQPAAFKGRVVTSKSKRGQSVTMPDVPMRALFPINMIQDGQSRSII
jgi:hypothetical protein